MFQVIDELQIALETFLINTNEVFANDYMLGFFYVVNSQRHLNAIKMDILIKGNV